MSARVTLQIEGQPERVLPLGAIFSIGRGSNNDLVLADGRASRNHAVIRLQGDRAYTLLDLGSSNGTLLNGRRVTIPCTLKNGDVVQVANGTLRFESAEESVPGKTSAEEDQGDLRTEVAFSSETVTILVVDIRSYTAMSEALAPERLSRVVGRWFQQAQEVIERHGGSIDKFLGDAAMAFWLKARTEGDSRHAVGPIQAAIELLGLATRFDREVSAEIPSLGFRIGCGINCGQAILGNIGVDARRDFTVVGDSVNVAFRLEKLCKELKRPIVLSEETRKAAGDAFAFEDLGLQKIRGKTQDVRVFSVRVAG
ncbi:MAG: FHA domain-containing protein [Verrucomicrobiae bacterium]|nr:FHA domain-containing protein [Verrucomicrobiae bacterium]